MFNLLKNKSKIEYSEYEFCPHCGADLTMQKGYNNQLSNWICKGCGQMLINPAVDTESDIVWVCDKCESTLNIQPGFDESLDEWKCTECGYVNRLTMDEVYVSEDEYQSDLKNPYKGLSDEDVLELSLYEDLGSLADREDIILIRDKETGLKYVKKLLKTYNRSIYDYLINNPIDHMPQIKAVYESNNHLIVIEEYIVGETLTYPKSEQESLRIAKCICDILKCLHGLPTPIIHRDIKPSNVMITPGGGVYLLDMNVAKWFDPDKTDDTRYMGTQYYAAPEQVGYGLTASSAKADIYAVGMLLNVMITGKFPKEERASGAVWDIIEKCISLNADDRYSADELSLVLEDLIQK